METNQCAYCGLKLQQGLEQMKAHIEVCSAHPMAGLKAENAALKEALQTSIGHSNCYCERCNAITRHWSPSKVEINAAKN